jgi:hypothetical protein
MNTSIVHSSLKYINNNYNLIVKLAKWIDEELNLINYSDLKLNKALLVKDIEIIKSIIKYVKDKNIMNKYLSKYWNHFEITKLMLENGADETIFIRKSLDKAHSGIYPKNVKIIYILN